MREGVWTHGENTEFEAWVAGESRTIVVTREAIEDYLRLSPEAAAAMPARERADFVRQNLAAVIVAATRKIDPSEQEVEIITLRSSDLTI
jgi:hypothetical protein